MVIDLLKTNYILLFQVFSCTPVEVNKKYSFEEFCSIHDFVCTCQDIFQEKLMIVHVSSCFSLKLDQSHVVRFFSNCYQ